MGPDTDRACPAALTAMESQTASILMVAGEASGDLHASKVVAAYLSRASGGTVFGVGGDRMRDAGMELVYHTDDFAVVGFLEVVKHMPRLRRALDRLTGEAVERGTRLAVLVDYPGFNLLLARRLRDLGIRVLYYISPQVWAWGEGRVEKIRRRVDRMAVVFPFEVDFYRERGVEVEFVGHPLMEEPGVARAPRVREHVPQSPVLGLLPGSRREEVLRHLPPMREAARMLGERVPGLDVRIGRAAGMDGALPGDTSWAGVVPADGVYDLMREATALIVSSGTATLEAACLGAPMAIVYRTSALSYAIGRLLVRVPDIGLVNVVAGRRVVPEFVQHEVTPAALADAVAPYLTDEDALARTSRALIAVREKLGGPGASERVADMMLEMLGEDS
ncbi:MAG: lipid-A-disaccharide synthase [Candidatus Eisenbacteria bacterium]|nr:lipid-A-disaccharide synthase [Candidatus Eisenbacteria bacterium]